MKRLWIAVAVVAGLVFLYLTALPGDLPADRDRTDGLAGTYTVNGVDHTDAEYSGTVVIVETEPGRVYDVEWIITGAIQRGTGTLAIETFTVDWSSTASAADATGRTVYTVRGDGSLQGAVTVDGVDGQGVETLVPEP